jgi:hypothetical protein
MTTTPEHVIRIYRRPFDGRFVTLSDRGECPIGVDASLPLAIATAERQAALVRREGCQVVIETLRSNGEWQRISVVEAPRPKGSPIVRRRALLANRVWRPPLTQL